MDHSYHEISVIICYWLSRYCTHHVRLLLSKVLEYSLCFCGNCVHKDHFLF